MPHFLAPRWDVFATALVSTEDFEDLAHRHRAHGLFCLEKRAWAGHGSRVHYFVAFEIHQIGHANSCRYSLRLWRRGSGPRRPTEMKNWNGPRVRYYWQHYGSPTCH